MRQCKLCGRPVGGNHPCKRYCSHEHYMRAKLIYQSALHFVARNYSGTTAPDGPRPPDLEKRLREFAKRARRSQPLFEVTP